MNNWYENKKLKTQLHFLLVESIVMQDMGSYFTQKKYETQLKIGIEN